MKLSELKKKSVKDLHKILAETREKLRALRFSVSNKQLKNIREIRANRRIIARVLTILNNSVDQKVTESNEAEEDKKAIK
ncbi:MAG: 50S ribosomal protein L29 [Parcubacteria group bacterium CG1_02_37_51]|uniref:Large ribosomal subunit protein uL29 n=2 Tax=Candidatus Komeiliibacteriota TaxID=1817908 RepID=A0A2M8DRG9_9BACT|nr:MAG: 50S ribosomal protein L29 [Parcubacteria group bacterium CG1_02_37_51]PIY94823.1 MAG: 50S ribosomal protein L29 [Candidatus Komeilibacteria bacterium CG_4_10_14_0_8_um_filter_37_78]PJC01985.1 MAG: 50S ribosomal protein L29 [Candidatus Komeilibacteria bacterium CG_4_9_14_0_8_um_filter_36_9]